MLKHLYKTFQIAVLSGSLLTFQSSVVFAAGTNSTDSNGTITNTQTHKFEKISDIDMLASLGMLAGGFITGRMLASYTPMTNDVMVAGAAGAAFIAGEIISNVKFKGTIDEMTEEVTKKSDGTINEEQIKRLQDLKKSYEEAKKTTKTKKTLQLASATAFGVAAAMAGYMAYTEFIAMRNCDAAILKAQVANGECVDTGTTLYTTTAPAACSQCGEELLEFRGMFTAIDVARKAPGPSLLSEKKIKPLQLRAQEMNGLLCTASAAGAPATMIKVKAAVGTICTAALQLTSINQIFSYKPANITSNNNLLNNILYANNADPKPNYTVMQSVNYTDPGFMKAAVNFLFPEAQASWIPMLGLGASTAGAFFLITGTTAVEVDLMMFVPFNRSIAFAGLAGVAFLAAKSSDNVISKLDENIKKIDAILADMAKMANGVKAQNLSQQQISIKTINPESNSQIPFSTNNSATSQCLQSNSTTNCKSVTDQLKSMPGFANLPDSFKDIASQATTLGDNVSGTTGISGSTLSQAEALGNKQNAISKLLKDRQAAYEKLTNGKVNYDKEQAKFLNKMNGAVKKALQQKGMTASGLMASMGTSAISGAGSKIDTSENLAKKPAAPAGVVDISAKDGEGKDKSLNLNFKDAPAENVAAVDMSGGTHGANPEYEIDSNEINGKNGPSLFDVISSRYIKSGYPKLLEEEPVKN